MGDRSDSAKNLLGDRINKTDGRPKQYESKKQRKNISVTPEGWEGIGKLAEQYGCSNKSEFIEKLGRGLIRLDSV